MTITFVCQSCEDSFDVDYVSLTEEAKGIKCPGCSKKLSASETDDLVTAIEELLGQVAALRKRFSVNLEIDAEDLPAPYDADSKKVVRGADDEDEEDAADDDEPLEDEPADDEDDDHF